MKFQDRLKKESRADLWKEYCGFLELSIDDYMYIQNRLMEEQIGKWSASGLGKKFLGDKLPQTVDEFRNTVPLTTYAQLAIGWRFRFGRTYYIEESGLIRRKIFLG